MHELSLCAAIAGVVRDHSAGRRVSRVALKVGRLRQVVPATLEFCWGIMTDGTDLAGCVLDVEHVPAVARCTSPSCGATAELARPILVCAACGGRSLELLCGEEFLVVSIDVKEVA